MNPSLRVLRRSGESIRRSFIFRFPRIGPNVTVVSGFFRVTNPVLSGEIIVSQRPAAGSVVPPVIRYRIVDANTLRPVTNAVTLRGTRTERLVFSVPRGTFRLQITNVGRSPAEVNGIIVVFN